MMHINKIVDFLFERIPERLFKALSEPVFAETDGIVQASIKDPGCKTASSVTESGTVEKDE